MCRFALIESNKLKETRNKSCDRISCIYWNGIDCVSLRIITIYSICRIFLYFIFVCLFVLFLLHSLKVKRFCSLRFSRSFIFLVWIIQCATEKWLHTYMRPVKQNDIERCNESRYRRFFKRKINFFIN